jgi:hypothetical protein
MAKRRPGESRRKTLTFSLAFFGGVRSWIVTVSVRGAASAAPEALLSATVNASSGSLALSALMAILICLVVSPGPKVTVPVFAA